MTSGVNLMIRRDKEDIPLFRTLSRGWREQEFVLRIGQNPLKIYKEKYIEVELKHLSSLPVV